MKDNQYVEELKSFKHIMKGFSPLPHDLQVDAVRMFDAGGYNAQGYNTQGFNADGYDRQDYNADGFDTQGFNADGYDANGFDTLGYNVQGFNRYGLNIKGLSREECDKFDASVLKDNIFEKDKDSLQAQNYQQDNREAFKLRNNNELLANKVKPVKYISNANELNYGNNALNLNPEDDCIDIYLKYARNVYGYIRQEFNQEDFYECLYNMRGCGQIVFCSYKYGYDEAGEPVYFISEVGEVFYKTDHF